MLFSKCNFIRRKLNFLYDEDCTFWKEREYPSSQEERSNVASRSLVHPAVSRDHISRCNFRSCPLRVRVWGWVTWPSHVVCFSQWNSLVSIVAGGKHYRPSEEKSLVGNLSETVEGEKVYYKISLNSWYSFVKAALQYLENFNEIFFISLQAFSISMNTVFLL